MCFQQTEDVNHGTVHNKRGKKIWTMTQKHPFTLLIWEKQSCYTDNLLISLFFLKQESTEFLFCKKLPLNKNLEACLVLLSKMDHNEANG